MTLDEFVERLEGASPSGGGFVALCPAHDDSNASLSVHGTDDRIIVNCHAGCSFEEIIGALDIPAREMFFHSGNWSEPEAVYQYRDEAGMLLFETVRFPGKKIKQRHPNEAGEMEYGLPKAVRRVLYRLPEIISAVSQGRTIYITEGEKDADALVAAGYDATCNPLGAGKWRDEFGDVLFGANVIIVADRDEPGRAHAYRVRDSLLGKAAGIWMFQAKVGKDVYDHLASGLPVTELVPLKERLRTGVYSGPDMADKALEYLELGEGDLPAYEVGGIPIAFRPGRLYTVGGYTGDGKSALALQILRGLCSANVPVTLFTLEMPMQDIQNRLLAHTGIPASVLERPWLLRDNIELEQLYRQSVEELRQWPLNVVFNPSVTSEQIRDEVIHGEPEFVIVDHIHRFKWGRERRDLEEQVQTLTNLALDYNIPVMVLAQLRRFSTGNGFEKFPRPTAQDFRETGVLEQESAMQIAVWRVRDEAGLRYDPSGQTQILVLKDRHGPLREHFLRFDGERQMFLPDVFVPLQEVPNGNGDAQAQAEAVRW